MPGPDVTLGPSGDPEVRRARSTRDDTDYDQRHFANLCAAIVLLTLAIAMISTIKALEHRQAMERCILSGRSDCIGIPRGGAYGPLILPSVDRR